MSLGNLAYLVRSMVEEYALCLGVRRLPMEKLARKISLENLDGVERTIVEVRDAPPETAKTAQREKCV